MCGVGGGGGLRSWVVGILFLSMSILQLHFLVSEWWVSNKYCLLAFLVRDKFSQKHKEKSSEL